MQDPAPIHARTCDAVVAICAFTLDRWQDLVDGVRAVAAQTVAPREVVVVIDQNPELLRRAAAELPPLLPGLRVLANPGPRGSSGARNAAFAASRSRFIVFLDDDAAPEPTWLERLLDPYRDPEVRATGGRCVPVWPGPRGTRPAWFPEEFDWVVGCSWRGLPTAPADVRNGILASMSFRRETFAEAGMLPPGRIGYSALGCEETELCIRILRGSPGARLRYVPDSVVRHRVTARRAGLRYFTFRCWTEGRSKARLTAAVGRRDALLSERDHVLRTLPRGVITGLADAARGRPAGLLRAGAIVWGLGVTLASYLLTTARERRRTQGAATPAPARGARHILRQLGRLRAEVRNWWLVGPLAYLVMPSPMPPRAGMYGSWLGRRQVAVRLRGGAIVRCRLDEFDGVLGAIVQRDYDGPGWRLQDVRRIIDAGANVGASSVWFASRCPAARILAIEPSPEVARRLSTNLAGNRLEDRVRVLRCALGAGNGTAHLVPGSSSIASRLGAAAPNTVAVPVATLEAVIAQEGWTSVDLLKLDCEGAEYDVLLGADSATLARVGAVVGEYHPVPGHGPAEITEVLSRAGFEVSLEDRGAGQGIFRAVRR